jgi:hypothetical protein
MLKQQIIAFELKTQKIYTYPSITKQFGVLLMDKELSLEKAVVIFEKSWKELVGEYAEARTLSTFCSEADVELHLAHKLLNKLPHQTVHTQFAVPFETERLGGELLGLGRVKMKKCFTTDIAIIDPIEARPYLFAELKFVPVHWGYPGLYLAHKKILPKETIDELKRALKRSIGYLQRMREVEPTQKDIEKIYLGLDKQNRTEVDKLIRIINDFEKREQEIVTAYLCVIDEFYPNIKEILQKAIKKYNPPARMKILTAHFNVYDSLKKTLEELEF